MKFMLLIVNPGQTPPSDEQMRPVLAQFQQLTADLAAQGKLVHSARLRPNAEAKTVRRNRDGSRMVVDGPFTETKEAVGGYYMIDCASQAEAIEWAKKFPDPFQIEVRQVWEM